MNGIIQWDSNMFNVRPHCRSFGYFGWLFWVSSFVCPAFATRHATGGRMPSLNQRAHRLFSSAWVEKAAADGLMAGSLGMLGQLGQNGAELLQKQRPLQDLSAEAMLRLWSPWFCTWIPKIAVHKCCHKMRWSRTSFVSVCTWNPIFRIVPAPAGKVCGYDQLLWAPIPPVPTGGQGAWGTHSWS